MQVISDYRTAMALLRNMGAATQGGVWHNLIQEIEKVRTHHSLAVVHLIMCSFAVVTGCLPCMR